MSERYGLFSAWEIRRLVFEGFLEFARVLKEDGLVLFKWNDHDVKLSDIIWYTLGSFVPLFGQRTSSRSRHASMTTWTCLIKRKIDK